ncbi:MAG: adenosylhomocysteinase [Candidatus Micrarchaeota archaeon]|nr:adenosylhomocysteinase [Candidatus Micrarchaeota archaeon]
MYKINDIKLAEQGRKQLEWAERHMPALVRMRAKYSKAKKLSGIRIAMCLHITKETGVLVRTLRAWGANVAIAAANPLSTQDDIAAALASEGINIFAWRGETLKEYAANIKRVLDTKPQIIIDDGGDLHAEIHKRYPNLKLIGGTEETTTGIFRVMALENKKLLMYPVIAVNNAYTKYLFDNRYGTGQSTLDGIIRATNIFIPGKTAVVAGYGWVGRGVVMRLHGLGARVIVTEVNPFRALEARMDGFEVMKMEDAAKFGDIFVTATGDRDIITTKHMLKMKDGTIVSNTGHFDVEIDVHGLKKIAKKVRRIREHMDEYTLPNGRKIFLLAEGRIVNLGAAEGHPSEVMDLSFCNQALSALYLNDKKGTLKKHVYKIPDSIDEDIARTKLDTMGVSIDRLTKAQKSYLESWEL